MFGSRFLDNGPSDFKKVYIFGKGDSSASFSFVQRIRHFCSLMPKMLLKWTYRRLRIIYKADFDFSTRRPPIGGAGKTPHH